MTELKPCPFCGGKPVVFSCDASGRWYARCDREVVLYGGRVMTHKLIRCEKCRVMTQPYKTDKGLFKAWNRRYTNG